ncbi:PTS sugar transporter subunit IIB [Microbacterium sp. 179-B 1A2 NHS]|uniref:PTS sugar transporter subunit IIB n=1 Tax=Microbacterium sp. 179-B 1A2 NHS TaxID=3142383 RepID=UPI0039A27796
MKILVVCGAGASSTFVAQRVRAAAQRQARTVVVAAGTPGMIAAEVDAGDVVLIGPHLRSALPGLRADAAGRGAHAVLLPADIFDDRDGSRTLALADECVAPAAPTERTPR